MEEKSGEGGNERKRFDGIWEKIDGFSYVGDLWKAMETKMKEEEIKIIRQKKREESMEKRRRDEGSGGCDLTFFLFSPEFSLVFSFLFLFGEMS